MNCQNQLPTTKNFIRFAFTLTAFLFISFCATAQGVLKGRVTDENQKSLSFTNIGLLKEDGKTLVTGLISDSTGSFSIATPAAGKYQLRITTLGYTDLITELFEVSSPSFNKDFGIIKLKEDRKKLNDVTVTALRPTITQLADKMVVSVEGTAMAAGNTAYAVLAKTPGVFIDHEGNISLNGRGGVTVMLDGKQTYLSNRDLKNLLESMPAENLKNIEIIINPSAKFDAEGTSGILNINLKKNTRQGINGSVFAGHNFNGKQHGYSAGANINYKKGKWNSFIASDFSKRVGGREGLFTRVFEGAQKTTYFEQTTNGQYKNVGPPSVRLGSDYNINNNHSIGFNARFATNTGKEEFFSYTYLGNAPKTPNQYIEAANYSKNTWTNYAGNVHYLGKLDTLGTTLSADLDYVKITNKGELNFYNQYLNMSNSQKTSDILFADVPNGYDIYAAKMDYSKVARNGQKFETGVKASRVTSDNNSKFYINNNGALVLDPKRTNHFNYVETIYAAYLNWSGNITKKITLQAGVRGENTKSLGNSYTTGQVTPNEYFNLFPSVFVQQKVSDNYNINYNYTRRLSRPNYGSLNPFRFYRDPYTWVEGNPYLRPQYAHVFSVTQTFKKTYNLILGYTRTKDVISELPKIIADSAQTVYYTGNVNKSEFASATAIAPIKIRKNWDVMNTVTLAHQKINMLVGASYVTNKQVYFAVQSNHTVVLPKSIRLEANLLYRGRAISGLYSMDPYFRADLGLRKTFAKKFELSFNVSDVLKSHRLKFQTRIGNNINDFEQYLRFRSFSTTFRYNFSKGIKTDARKNNNLEEAGRAGGN
jgi:hypothetical protein